ncbi:MAG TPA: hypothetical protein VGF28_01285 [Thermoanaerobaculia bacterium]|jgi:hypothetical protein
MSSRGTCAACNRAIDEFAKLCPYCGANPQTGERMDTQAILQEIFKPKETTTSASVLEYARQRQGAVIGVTAFVLFLIIAGLHQFVSMRNETAVTDSPAVPLTEITDLTNRPDETRPRPLPELNFPFEGRPQAMRTYILEPGAIAPAPPAPPPGAAPAPAPGAAPATGTVAPPAVAGPRPAAAPQPQRR